jgi:hypothetical protein
MLLMYKGVHCRHANPWTCRCLGPKTCMGKSMKNGANCTKVKVFSKDYIFHMVVFYWFIMHFSHSFSNWISNLRLNITYNMIKIQFCFASIFTLQSQNYKFTLNHDYKLKTIIMFQDVRISKSKRVYVFLFF